MAKGISGIECPLSKIFSSEFSFEIPSYQRPYAWTVEQTSELFEDLYDFFNSQKEDAYFLGSIVLIKKDGIARSEVIDGQQRLTTLTILLSVIAASHENLKDDYGEYVNEPGRESQGLDPQPRLTLRDRDSDFFTKYVHSQNFDELFEIESGSLDNDAKRNIQSNSRLLFNLIVDKFGDDISGLAEFGKFLVGRCILIAVSTPSRQSAFRVFSVLNNRGLDLLPTDIIKAEVIGNIPIEKQSIYTMKWEDLEDKTGREGFHDLFSYIRMIYARKKAKQALREEFKEHVQSNSISSEELIENVLEPYAKWYNIVKINQYMAPESADEVNQLLKFLNRIDNSDWIPPVILFLSKFGSDSNNTLNFLKKFERLAAYLHICARNINQRIERYAQVIDSLKSMNETYEFPDSLDLSAIEINQMRFTLDSNIYELTARRRNYLILRLDSFLSDGGALYEPSVLTIEHVLPQTVLEGSEWEIVWSEEERIEWVHRLANLVPLTRPRNSSAQNYNFETKKEKYFKGYQNLPSHVLTTKVLAESEWTPEVVLRRQNELLAVLHEKWELHQPE